MEKLKLKEAKLLADIGRLAAPEKSQFKDIKLKIKSLSKTMTEESEQSNQLDQLFLDKHRELSRLINSVSNWGERKLKFDATLGSIETVDTSDQIRKLSESEDSPEVEMKRRTFKIKLIWNRCPHPMGVAECPWRDDLVDDQLIYIAAADSKMVVGIEG